MPVRRSYSDLVLHELWIHGDGQSFCLSGPLGDRQRALIPAGAELSWTVAADSHFEAMTLYHEHMGWPEYTSDFPDIDKQTYTDRGWK